MWFYSYLYFLHRFQPYVFIYISFICITKRQLNTATELLKLISVVKSNLFSFFLLLLIPRKFYEKNCFIKALYNSFLFHYVCLARFFLLVSGWLCSVRILCESLWEILCFLFIIFVL